MLNNICSMNNLAGLSSIIVSLQGMKCVIFVHLSTTTKIESRVLKTRGSIIKSKDNDSFFEDGCRIKVAHSQIQNYILLEKPIDDHLELKGVVRVRRIDDVFL